MTAAFGFKPIRRDIVLSTGADFVLSLRLQNGAHWPENTRLYIKLPTTVWEAYLYDGVASWKVESQITDTVTVGSSYQLYVQYPPSVADPETTDFMWFYGKVRRTRMR